MGGFSPYTQQGQGPGQGENTRWRPMAIAVTVVVIVGALLWFLSRGKSNAPVQPAVAPYSADLQVGDLRLSTAENFVGGRVTYLQGKITNTGTQVVTGALVETIFRNDLGEVVDRQTQPLRISAAPLGNPDWVLLSAAPLAPSQSGEFRLTFEHISADWNMGYPELRFPKVDTR